MAHAKMILADRLNLRCIEPRKRMVGGQLRWAVHRFPIRGGISMAEVLQRDIVAAVMRPSYLTHLLRTVGE